MVWAISDLHLPARQKPMDIFGPHLSLIHISEPTRQF